VCLVTGSICPGPKLATMTINNKETAFLSFSRLWTSLFSVLVAATAAVFRCSGDNNNDYRTLSLSIFRGHFPGRPGRSASNKMSPLWNLMQLRMTKMAVTTGAIRRSKLQSNHHHQQTNTQLFTGQMPFLLPNQQCQSTEGKKRLLTRQAKLEMMISGASHSALMLTLCALQMLVLLLLLFN